MKRAVAPEWLDDLPAQDPRAQRSRRDLRRLNRLMGHAAIVARALLAGVPAARRLVELGAGDGTLMLGVARRLRPAWGGGSLLLVDRQRVLSAKTHRAFSAAGWDVQTVVADALDWLVQPPAPACEAMVANLFLHHFSESRLVELLGAVARTAQAFVALEPRRSPVTHLFSRGLGLAACGPVTRHDAPISVRAGFAGRELSQLWPADGEWHLEERSAGWFSHLFVARRAGAGTRPPPRTR